MKATNANPPGHKAVDAARGRAHTARASSQGIRFIDTSSGLDVIAATVYVDGALVTDADADEDDAIFITIGGSTGTLAPESTVVTTKAQGNPTFNFASVPENVVKVGSTYYCVYMTDVNITATFRLATSTSRDGPWTAGTDIYTVADVPWLAGSDGIYSPFIIVQSGTYYLFYSGIVTGGATSTKQAIGYATATAITGPYTDHGSAILSPSASGLWDSRRVGEPSVIFQGGQWIMAYMGEDSDIAYQESEKVGIATAPDPAGPWTRAAGNPVIDFGASGQWDDELVADPDIFYLNGYYWIMYAGGPDTTTTTALSQGLAYATDPEGPYTRYANNPILVPGTSGTWDDTYVWRGGVYIEDGTLSGVYAGYDGAASIKGGNFTFNVTGVADDPTAEEIPIVDVGGYFTDDDVEGALQEAGAAIAALQAGSGGGHYEVIVSGTGPPVAVTNAAGTDWLYGFVPD